MPGIRIYGGRIDNVAACTDPLDWVATALPDHNSVRIFRFGSRFSRQEHCDKFNIGAIEVLSEVLKSRADGHRLRTEVCALHTPGHTRGSICYHCSDATDQQAGVRKTRKS